MVMVNNSVTQQLPNEVIGFISVQYRHHHIGEDVLFVINCINVPTGSIVSFSGIQAGPEPPIELAPTIVSDSKQFGLGKLCYIPADFAGEITLRYTFFVLPLPERCSIELLALIPVTPDDERYNSALSLSALNMVLLNLPNIPINMRFIKQEVKVIERLSA
jgi:hypothetical protein